MKKSFLFWVLLLVLGSTSAFAQHQKEKESFLAEFEWNFTGDYTYNYILQENGMKMKDGPFEMNAIADYQSTITGEYTLAGNHSDGYLHGLLTMNANFQYPNGNNTYAFKGNFKYGLPDGNFKVEYPSCGIYVDVNYMDGYLVGRYYVKGKDRLPYEISGTLTSDGKPTGVWKFDYSTDSYEMSFSNGVVITRADYDPDLTNMAKNYAAGSVTREELFKENICVKEDSLQLGKDAWNLVLHKGICFDKLGNCAFVQSGYVKYSYLDRLPFFSEEGLEVLQQCLTTSEGFNKAAFSTGQSKKDLYQEFYGGVIRYDENLNMYYCTLHNSSVLCDYCVGFPNWNKHYEDVYLTEEQVVELRVFLHVQRMQAMDRNDIGSLKYKNFEYFEQCPYDEDVLVYTYNFNSYPGLMYFSRDAFEDYFINKGMLKELLDFTPDARIGIVEKKYNEHLEACAAKVTKWFRDYVVNVDYEKLGNEFIPANENCFPIVSYKTDSIISLQGSNLVILSSVDVRDDSGMYRSYKVNIYADVNEKGVPKVDICSTFNKANYIRVRNDYDVIEELDALINEKKSQVKVLAANKFKPYYSSYTRYINGLQLSLNHSDIKASIDERKALLSVLENIFVFVELLDEIYKGDAEVDSKCSDVKDVNKAYSAYLKTRNLAWRPEFHPADFDEYLESQKECIEFAELRRLVARYDAQIKEQKSVAPYIFKEYKVYRSDFDLVWKPDVDFALIKNLLEVQDRYLNVFVEKMKAVYEGDNEVAVKCSDIKDVNKAYSAYLKTRRFAWRPDFRVEEFDEYFEVQESCIEFAELRRQVAEYDVKIKEQKAVSPSNFKAYKEYRSGFELAWNSEVDFAEIQTLLETQDEYLNVFVENLKAIYEGDGEVAQKKAQAKDVVKAYSAYTKNREMLWLPGFDAKMFDEHFEIQKRCLEFIELRVSVQANDAKIKEKKSNASHIYKAYNTYKNKCDLTWSTNVDFAQIKALIEIQDRCFILMNKGNIKQINKALKKQKKTDIIEILNEN